MDRSKSSRRDPPAAEDSISSRRPRRLTDSNDSGRIKAHDTRDGDAPDAAEDPDSLLTNRQGAALLGVSLPTFYAMLKDRHLPPAYYVRPYTPRWRKSELLAAAGRSRGYPDEMKGHARSMKILQEAKS